jgi:hypothetical protein
MKSNLIIEPISSIVQHAPMQERSPLCDARENIVQDFQDI